MTTRQAAKSVPEGLQLPLMHLLRRASQAADALCLEPFGNAGMTPRQWVVLAAIAAGEGANQTDLVNLTGIDRSTIAEIMRRLHKAGLVRRQRSRKDARAYVVSLSSEGRRAFEAGQVIAASVDDAIMQRLPARGRREFLEALHALIQPGDRPSAPARS